MPNKSRNWVFTLNNPTDDELIALIASVDLDTTRYLVFQKEVAPTTGTLHIQGLIVFTNARTLAGLTRRGSPLTRAHLEVMRGTIIQARQYCMKNETRLPGSEPVEIGNMPSQGSRTDLAAMGQWIREAVNPPTELEMWNYNFQLMVQYGSRLLTYRNLMIPVRNWEVVVHTYWSKSSGIGKSRRAFHEAGPGSYVLLPGTKSQPGKLWVDGYTGQKNIIIDDFDGWIDYRTLLRMLDRYALQLEVKGSSVTFAPTHIWITSNLDPAYEWYEGDVSHLMRRLSQNDSRVIHMSTYTRRHPWEPPEDIPIIDLD